MSLYVFLGIDGKGSEFHRRRDLIFQYKGAGVRLRQTLHKDFGTPYYTAELLPSEDCSTCASSDPLWAADLAEALKAASAFEERSRFHWDKKTQSKLERTVEVSISVGYTNDVAAKYTDPSRYLRRVLVNAVDKALRNEGFSKDDIELDVFTRRIEG